MRVAIPALGTRGDVQPYVALGVGLRRAGHEVLVCTLGEFRGLVEGHGLEYQRMPGDSRVILDWDPMTVSQWRPLKHIALVHSELSDLVGAVRPADLLEGWGGVDLVVFGNTTTWGHFHAETLGVPSVLAALTPTVATGEFAHPLLVPRGRLGPWGNYASWIVGEHLQRQTFQEPTRPDARRALGLPLLPRPRRGGGAARWPPVPVVHGFSPALIPRPSDWPAHVEVTGTWTTPADGELPAEVAAFLDDGPAPVYIGFGSMPVTEPERVGSIIAGALRRSGRRAIVSGLRADALERAGGSVLTVDGVPHDALFERLAGVVHHGGAGTVDAGLRAGRPTLVVPFVFDQFFWARRVELSGAGPRSLPYARLEEEALARALDALGEPRVRDAAQRLGARIREEDGVARAVAAIERAAS